MDTDYVLLGRAIQVLLLLIVAFGALHLVHAGIHELKKFHREGIRRLQMDAERQISR